MRVVGLPRPFYQLSRNTLNKPHAVHAVVEC